MYLFRNLAKWTEKIYVRLSKFLFWGGILRFLMEIYLEVSVSTFINLSNVQFVDSNSSSIYCFVLCIIFLCFIVVFPLSIIIYYGMCNQNNLGHPNFKSKYGDIYCDMRIEEQPVTSLFFAVFFLLRRLVFTLTAIYLGNHLYLQLLILFTCTWIMSVYILSYKPFEHSKLNKLETFNEICFTFFLYNLICFTEFVNGAEIRYLIGWCFIVVFILYIMVHIFFLS